MITNITDKERAQAMLIIALKDASHEMAKRIESLTAELAQAYADSRQTVDDAAAVARENTALRKELAEARLQFVAAFGQEQERGWQPIESAPKDGAEFLMTNGVNVSSGQWFAGDDGTFDCDGAPNGDERDAGWMDWSGGMQPDPTHWQPLPTPPADKPIWDQLAEIGASDPQAWKDKP